MKVINIIIRVCLFMAGMVGFTGLVMPFIKRRILNIGNAAGLSACMILMAYALFMPRINILAGRLWQKTAGKIIISAVVFCIAVMAALVAAMTVCMIKAVNTKPMDGATAVVLGCRVYGERPSLMLTERMDAALKYLNENPEAVCIASGGQGADEDISEAECIYRYLAANGIDKWRIYKEDKSVSTRENIAFSYEIIEKNGLEKHIAIVTNEFHEYRAGMIADSMDIDYGAVPGNTALWLLPTYYARELFGILYEWIF